jgi:hypothetical protein
MALCAKLSGEELEEALAALLYDDGARVRLRGGDAADPRFESLAASELDEAAGAVRRMVRERVHRGIGVIDAWFPRTLAAWRAEHPKDGELDDLFSRFCASSACKAWSELGRGISLEEAFYRFLLEARACDPAIAEDEFLGAVVRALAVTPAARFEWPKELRRAPGGCCAVSSLRYLHAAVDGAYLHGPVTDVIVDLLEGHTPEQVAGRHSLESGQIGAVVDALRAKKLLALAPGTPVEICDSVHERLTHGPA